MKINVKLSSGDSSISFETDSEKLEKRLAMAQKILDSEVLRRCDPYVPRYYRFGRKRHNNWFWQGRIHSHNGRLSF